MPRKITTDAANFYVRWNFQMSRRDMRKKSILEILDLPSTISRVELEERRYG